MYFYSMVMDKFKNYEDLFADTPGQEDESDELFLTEQESELVEIGRNEDESLEKWASEFRDQPVPRPPSWGGYRVIPEKIEFWSDRENRMHERMLFEKIAGNWAFRRLAP